MGGGWAGYTLRMAAPHKGALWWQEVVFALVRAGSNQGLFLPDSNRHPHRAQHPWTAVPCKSETSGQITACPAPPTSPFTRTELSSPRGRQKAVWQGGWGCLGLGPLLKTHVSKIPLGPTEILDQSGFAQWPKNPVHLGTSKKMGPSVPERGVQWFQCLGLRPCILRIGPAGCRLPL